MVALTHDHYAFPIHLNTYTYSTEFYDLERYYKEWGRLLAETGKRHGNRSSKDDSYHLHQRMWKGNLLQCRQWPHLPNVQYKIVLRLLFWKSPKKSGSPDQLLSSFSYNSELMNLNRVTSMQLWLEKYNRVAIWINLWCQSQQDKMYKTCSMKTTWSSLSSSIKNQLSSSPVYTQLGQRTKPIFQCAAIKTIIRY